MPFSEALADSGRLSREVLESAGSSPSSTVSVRVTVLRTAYAREPVKMERKRSVASAANASLFLLELALSRREVRSARFSFFAGPTIILCHYCP